MKNSAMLITVDGEERKLAKSPTLEEAQKMVEGYVEMLTFSLPVFHKYDIDYIDGAQALFNEDGLMKKMPLNERASYLVRRPLVGPVIILTGNRRWT